MTCHNHHGEHDHTHAPNARPFLKTPGGWVLIVFLAIGAFYLITEHTAHVFGVLPYLLLLACPLGHLFMHGGHGGHEGHDHGSDAGAANNSSKESQP